MHIKNIKVQNFRLLKDVNLLLDVETTVIVGRNNSGKTSLTELSARLLTGSSARFSMDDFSLGTYEEFWAAYRLWGAGKEDLDVRAALPYIEAVFTISYDAAADMGTLSEFIIDLDETSTDTLVEIRYELEEGKIKNLFDAIDFGAGTPNEGEKKKRFYKALKERLPKNYKARLAAVDPKDSTNRKSMEWSSLSSILRADFINAHRGLDDTTHKDNDVLGKILSALFGTALTESADLSDRTTAQELVSAIQGIQEDVDTKFNKHLDALLPTFDLFGYPGLPDSRPQTETSFDVERLLSNHTKIRYRGVDGTYLPEAYNGLGVRNLIFILLKLHEFFKAYKAAPSPPGVHLVFIEEPEAHLHPQMQEVFISKLNKIAEAFVAQSGGDQKWPVRFVVTTHSSHVANRAEFKAMRYFLATPDNLTELFCSTKVKDLSTGLGGTAVGDQKFLHQYMTLTRCDLLFADKAILIEGTSERLLLPKMIEKSDAVISPTRPLSSQYVSVMEVGGAYAHKFFKLLEFLELKTLIITDLDPAKPGAGGSLEGSNVSDGTRTTNACIKDWFGNPAISPADLGAKTDSDKTRDQLRLAFQVSETASRPCGRSFEEAFILANPTLFSLTTTSSEADAVKIAEKQKKTAFALKYALDETTWAVPRYIGEGLKWLTESDESVAPTATTPLASTPVAGATKKAKKPAKKEAPKPKPTA